MRRNITLRLDPQTYTELSDLAVGLNSSRTEVVRVALQMLKLSTDVTSGGGTVVIREQRRLTKRFVLQASAHGKRREVVLM